jgi:hypothetical protein
MKKTISQQASEFEAKIIARIQKKVSKSKKESVHRNDIAILVSDECSFNLDGGRWLHEVIESGLIDNEGYEYSFETLPRQQLFELADEILKTK